MSIDTVLHDISFANIQLYSAVLPSYSSKKNKGEDEFYIEDDPARADALLGITR